MFRRSHRRRDRRSAWAWIAAVLRLRFQVLEVISTIMLNFVAAYLVSYLVRGPMQEPTHIYPQTASIAHAARLPRFGATTRLHLGFVIAVLACLAGWWMIRYTAGGFRLRVVGANPHAARSAGQIDVERVCDARISDEWRARRSRRGDRGLRRDLCAVREHLARVRIHGNRRRAARAVERRGGDRDGHSVRRARGGCEQRCSATRAFRRSSCRSSKRASFSRSLRLQRARMSRRRRDRRELRRGGVSRGDRSHRDATGARGTRRGRGRASRRSSTSVSRE